MKLVNQLRWVFAVQAVLLGVAAWRNLHQLNPDAIAYLRIAGYYASGQTELALSGYWGPLLSWLMVPLLKLGAAPLVAARLVMAGSGVVFLAGALAVFRTFRLPRVALVSGMWLAAGWSVFWSVRNITPDLLMAGLVALAVSATLRLSLSCKSRGEVAAGLWLEGREANRAERVRLLTSPATAGAWWGLAYLAKAVALPLGLVVSAALAVVAMRGRRELWAGLAVRLGLVWLGLAVVAGPWIGALSVHYGEFTFSTTGAIAHALAGPGAGAGSHPAMSTLYQPEPGRMTQWEEPSRMAYERWAPLASEENFRHQLAVMWTNAGVCWNWLSPWRPWLAGADLPTWRRWLGGFDLLGFGGLAVLGAGVCAVRNRNRLRRVRWCWAALPVVVLGGLYLPFFVMAEDNRYFYPVLPLVWVLGCAGLTALPRGGTRRLASGVLLVSYALSAGLWCGAALRGLPNPAAEVAQKLAERLHADAVHGPVAGSALMPGGRTGLYTAFLLGERWLGDSAHAGPSEFATVGARIVIVRRGSSAAAAFAQSPAWREWGEIDKRRLSGESDSNRLIWPSRTVPVQVFERPEP